MIVVDSSVWIDHLNDVETQQVVALRQMIRGDILGPILVGELILFEVLAGLGSRGTVARIRVMFEAYVLASMLDFELAEGRCELPGATPPRDHRGGRRHGHRHVLHRDGRRAADRRSRFSGHARPPRAPARRLR